MEQKKVLKAIKELCTGCRTCEIMCSLAHSDRVNPVFSRIKIRYGKTDPLPYPIVCEHCQDAPCKASCPMEEAMVVEEHTGVIRIDQDHCTQCLSCVEACPLGAIQVGPDQTVLKCDLCGGDPVCAKFCPEEPGHRFPHMPWDAQACLQVVEASDAVNRNPSIHRERQA